MQFSAADTDFVFWKYRLANSEEARKRREIELTELSSSELNTECNYNDNGDTQKVGELFLAIRRSRLDTVDELIREYSVNIDALNSDGKTPLIYAIENGVSKIVDVILKHNPDRNNPINKWALKAALSLHIYPLYLNIVDRLIEYGFTIIHGFLSNDSLQIAIASGNLNVINEMIRDGLDCNVLMRNCFRPLHFAILMDELEVAELLLNNGADVNVRDLHGFIPLYHAIGKNLPDSDFFSLLLSKGVDVESYLRSIEYDYNVIFKKDTAGNYYPYLSDKVMILDELKYYPTLENNPKLVPIHVAAYYGHDELIESLLEFHVDVNSRDSFGRSALHIASRRRYPLVVSLLLETGADINMLDEFGQTAFQLASSEDAYENDDTSELTLGFYDLTTDGTIGTFIDHMIKLTALNLNVIDYFNGHMKRRSEFQQDILKEVNHMKTEKIADTNISFYDVARSNLHHLSIYAKNPDLIQALKTEGYLGKFPFFEDMILFNIKRGETRRLLIDECTPSLMNDLPKVPDICFELILSYLSDKELRFLRNCIVKN